jgi:hypothetical protein
MMLLLLEVLNIKTLSRVRKHMTPNRPYHFITTLILTYFNPDFKYIVKIDLSNYVLRGVLL